MPLKPGVRAGVTLLPSLCPDASHHRSREALVRRKAAEPHLEDGGIYRMGWWAYFDDRQNYLRDVARPGRLAKVCYSAIMIRQGRTDARTQNVPWPIHRCDGHHRSRRLLPRSGGDNLA